MNNTYLNKFKAGEYVDPALLEYEKLQNLQSENQKKAEETERLERLREAGGNPVYGMQREEALNYALQMGATDTFRGIGQLFSKGLGIESIDNKLKKDYEKFNKIIENEEFGTEAFVTFLSSAIALDPASYVPVVGWMQKAKHSNNLWKTTKYAGKSGFVVGGLGYTDEEAMGLIADKDDSFLMKKLEQAGIAGTAAMTLVGLGAGAVDLVYKAKTGKSIFAGSNEVIAKDANTKIEQSEKVIDRKLAKGDLVTAPDRDNTGKIIFLNEEEGIARVLFVNKEKGTSATKNFSIAELEARNFGKPINPKEVKEVNKTVQRPEEAVFIYNDKGNLVTRDNNTKITYEISKAVDEQNNVIKGQWEITATSETPKIKRKKGESIANLQRRKKQAIEDATNTTIVGSKTKAKQFVQNKIKPDVVDPVPITKEKIIENLKEEVIKEPENKNIATGSILESWENGNGKLIWDLVRRNPIEFSSTIGGGSVGYMSAEDPNATETEKMFRAVIGASSAYASLKGAKIADLKFFQGDGFKYLNRNLIHNYGLDKNHILRRKKFQDDKNDIMRKFSDIAKNIFTETTEEQQQILYQFMTGEITNLPKTFNMLQNLSEDGRKLITKYAQELSDRGLINPKTFQKNMDTYLHRSYKFHEARNLNFSKTAMFDVDKKIKLMGDELKPRGIRDTVSRKKFEDPDGDWQKEGWEILGEDITVKKRTENDKLTVRRDLTKAERLELEEIENASYALLQTGRLLANDLSAARFFDDIAADSNVTLTKKQFDNLNESQQKNYVQIPDTRIEETAVNRFGDNLPGKYVEIEVANDITNIFNLNKSFTKLEEGFVLQGIDSAQTVWKKMKTVYNPATHTGNIISNFMLMDVGANVPYRYLAKAAKEMAKSRISGERTKIYSDAVSDGIADSSLITKELNKDSFSIIEKDLIELSEAHGVQKTWQGKKKKILGVDVDPVKYWEHTKNISSKINKYTLKQLEDLYQAEDTVFRLATYMHRLDNGRTRAQASAAAKKWFIDYDINAPFIKQAKRFAVPFISYPYKAIPLVLEGSIRRPAKFLKWVGGVALVNEISEKVMGDPDEINQYTMRDSVNKNMFGIPIFPKTNVRLPFNDKYGQPLYIDIQRYLPGGNVFDAREEAPFRLPGLPDLVQPGGFFIDAGVTFGFQEDPFTGEDLSDKTFSEQLVHFAERFPPNIPYLNPKSFSTKAIEKAKRAETGRTESGISTTPSPYTALKTPWITVLSGLGIRINPQNEDINLAAAYYKIDEEVDKLINKQAKLDTALINENIDEKEYTREWEKLEDRKNIEYMKRAALEDFVNEERSKRTPKATGGFVEGEDNVPFTKQNPAERVNPYTGMPYKQADLTEGGILAGLLRNRMDRVGFNEGGELSNDEVIKDFILKAEDVALYNDYKAGNLEKIVKAHTGSERFKDLHGKSDKETLAGVTGSGVSETTVGDAVDNVLQKALNETQQEYNRLVPEDVQNNRSVNDQRALFSLLFNVGATKLQNSNALKAFREGRMSDFYKEGFDRDFGFTKVTGSDGEKRKDIGLVNRRKAELKLAQGSLESPMKIEEVVLPTRVSLKERLAKRAENG